MKLIRQKKCGSKCGVEKKSKTRKSWPVILSYLSRTAQGYLRQCGLVVYRIHILHTSWGWLQSLLLWRKLGDRIFSNGFRLQVHREVCSSKKLVFFFILMCRSQKIVSTELKASFCPTDHQVPKQEFLTIIWHWTISCLSESSILCLAIKKSQKKKITIEPFQEAKNWQDNWSAFLHSSLPVTYQLGAYNFSSSDTYPLSGHLILWRWLIIIRACLHGGGVPR